MVGAQQFDGPSLRFPTGLVREQVQVNEAVRQGLARHGVFLVPNPPHPPTYAAIGTQYGDLQPGKVGRALGLVHGRILPTKAQPQTSPDPHTTQDWAYQAGSDEGEGTSWCTMAGAAPNWTSEKGSVMLDGRPIFLKGINWCVGGRGAYIAS